MQYKLRAFAIILLIVLGIGGVYGGWMLISDPSGQKFQWTIELLEGTPFKNFFIPGVILIIVNGLFPLLIAALTIVKTRNHAWLVVMQGCVLIGWLTAEIIFNRELFSPVMHPLFYTIGILLLVIGAILIKTSKVDWIDSKI